MLGRVGLVAIVYALSCGRIITTRQIDGVLPFMVVDNSVKELYILLSLSFFRIVQLMSLDKWLPSG